MSIDLSQKVKAKQLHDFFQDAGRIYIVVDATVDGVDVPDYLKGDPALRLALNVRMRQPIYIRDEGVSSVLSFSGQPHDCFIPLQAIWGAYEPDGDLENGLIWEDAVPQVIRVALGAQMDVDSVEESDIETVDLDATPQQLDTSRAESEEGVATRPTKVPHLRVVK